MSSWVVNPQLARNEHEFGERKEMPVSMGGTFGRVTDVVRSTFILWRNTGLLLGRIVNK